MKGLLLRETAGRRNEARADQFDSLSIRRHVDQAAPTLAARTRLDDHLWRQALNLQMSKQDADIIANDTLARTMDRYQAADAPVTRKQTISAGQSGEGAR